MKVFLKSPSVRELYYRQNWMNDPDTMNYNAGYDIDLKGYNKVNGTINKSVKEMEEWFNKWNNKEPEKYFAYIYVDEIVEPIGEIYYYLDDGTYNMGILIQSKYRGKGYSYLALKELQKIAFEKNYISELSDMIPLDRVSAIKSFKKAGFIHTDKEEIGYVFGRKVVSKELLITRKMYFSNN